MGRKFGMARTNPAKGSASKRVNRRSELRRTIRRPGSGYRALINRPEFVKAAAVLLGFILVGSVITIWSREQLRVAPGLIMTETRLNRLDFEVTDKQATKAKREEARRSSPRVYRANTSYLDGLSQGLMGLPQAVAGKTQLSEISDVLAEQFGLTEEGLVALQRHVVDGDPTPSWRRWVERLIDGQLAEHPFLDSVEYQLFLVSPNKRLLMPDGTLERRFWGEAIEMQGASSEQTERVREFVSRAGFPQEVIPFVVARLLFEEGRPTIQFDAAMTEQLADQAAAAVEPETIHHPSGEILFRQGDRLSAEQYSDLRLEDQEYRHGASAGERWTTRFGIVGFCLILALVIGVFSALNYPRLVQNTLRLAALCLLMSAMLAISVAIVVRAPAFLYAAAIGPTLFLTVVVLLAYDQRLALVISAMQAALLSVALVQSPAWFVLLVSGCATMIALLPEVRNRNSLIRAATLTAIGFGAGSVLLGLLEVPQVGGAWRQIFANAGGAAAASFSVGFLVLGILPSIERLFDITTGMTLAELRDPKQPLLRQLQQKAPGTYNHSLQVANIAKAAADAINANGLLRSTSARSTTTSGR